MASSLRDFREAALQQVNSRRHLHASPPLSHSAELQRSAQTWAEALAAKGALANSDEAKRGDYGESISQRTSQSKSVDITAEEVVSQWYNEKTNYNFADGSGKGGNFSQMVWQASREVGFGKAFTDGKVIVVAHYNPPGNVRGRYAKNVNPPLDTDLDAAELVGELAGFKIASREVLRDEEIEGGRTVIVERERIEFKDPHGNTKEKVIERRINKPKAGEKPAGAAAPTSTEKSPDAEAVRRGTVLPMKDKELSKFGKEVLSQHNKHRSRHGVKSLKLNSDLSALAQSFAEDLSGKAKLHNSGTTYKGDRLGENIASRWSNGPTDYDGEEVVDHWYSEADKFRYDEEPTDIKGVGNFTQMVWKNTKELGVGKAIHKGTDGSHKVVVVCYYHPSGNVMPCFRENVHPPSK